MPTTRANRQTRHSVKGWVRALPPYDHRLLTEGAGEHWQICWLCWCEVLAMHGGIWADVVKSLAKERGKDGVLLEVNLGDAQALDKAIVRALEDLQRDQGERGRGRAVGCRVIVTLAAQEQLARAAGDDKHYHVGLREQKDAGQGREQPPAEVGPEESGKASSLDISGPTIERPATVRAEEHFARSEALLVEAREQFENELAVLADEPIDKDNVKYYANSIIKRCEELFSVLREPGGKIVTLRFDESSGQAEMVPLDDHKNAVKLETFTRFEVLYINILTL